MVGTQDRSQNISLSKSKVKFDFSTFRSRVLPILKGIEVKMYPAKIVASKCICTQSLLDLFCFEASMS